MRIDDPLFWPPPALGYYHADAHVCSSNGGHNAVKIKPVLLLIMSGFYCLGFLLFLSFLLFCSAEITSSGSILNLIYTDSPLKA